MPTQKYTQKELKNAYSLVSQDLFNRLVQAKENETVTIGTLGSFGSLRKSEGQMVSKLGNETHGNTYVFYRIKFTPAKKLKQVLNSFLEKKYR